jgi:hypothetical protein
MAVDPRIPGVHAGKYVKYKQDWTIVRVAGSDVSGGDFPDKPPPISVGGVLPGKNSL